MRKLLLLILLSSQAFATKTLTSSFAFTDAQGNPCVSCYIVFNLSRGGNLLSGGEIVPVPPIRIDIGVAGLIIPGQSIIANDEIQPTGTYYMVRIFNNNNVLVRGPEKWILSGGAPIDLSLMIDVSVPDPGLASPVIQNPSQAQTISGFSLTLSATAPLLLNDYLSFLETTAPSAVANRDVCYGDSTAHSLKCAYNNGSFLNVPQTIATGTAALGTGAISATTCATVVTVAATGVATTDTIAWSFNAAPGTGYTSGLNVLPYVTSGNVNFIVCNATAGSLTPAAATLNWRVTR